MLDGLTCVLLGASMSFWDYLVFLMFGFFAVVIQIAFVLPIMLYNGTMDHIDQRFSSDLQVMLDGLTCVLLGASMSFWDYLVFLMFGFFAVVIQIAFVLPIMLYNGTMDHIDQRFSSDLQVMLGGLVCVKLLEKAGDKFKDLGLWPGIVVAAAKGEKIANFSLYKEFFNVEVSWAWTTRSWQRRSRPSCS
mmetsp:Transcript_99523/g.286248  ORF Transcript_99523/g.286248 Transcript_99523/m.286248 type:complete len:190 (+) Transcript_99523:1-570(+)